MKIIHANSYATLALGRCGENLARKVIFDITDFESLYGVGTVEILYQRPNDAQPYPLAVQRDGTIITWNVTSTDTATPSEFGKCELRYYSGDTLVKSKIWQTWVDNALSTPSETTPPEPEQGWVDKVLAAGQAAVDASVNSPKIGSNGNWWVWDFEAGAYVDTGVAASGGGAVSSVNGRTGDVTLTAGDVGAVSVPATASVGQTVVVKAVDDSGKPTEWEAADMSSESNFELIEKIIVGYSILAEQPEDWESGYSSYFENTGTVRQPVYKALTEYKQFEIGKYYSYTGDGVLEILRDFEPDGTGYLFKSLLVIGKFVKSKSAYNITFNPVTKRKSVATTIGPLSTSMDVTISMLASKLGGFNVSIVSTPSSYDWIPGELRINRQIADFGNYNRIMLNGTGTNIIPSNSEITIYGVRA